jgi:thiol-disulfide isomerase/thioredoxin
MSNWLRYTWAAAGLAVLASALYGASKEAAKADLTLKDMNGKKVRLRDLQGKIVVLNFWATWCGPCNQEMPLLVEAEKEYGPRGVVFIGASLDDEKTRANIPAFLRKYQVAFPVWVGAGPDELEKLGMGEAVPDTAFIDAEGRIVARVLGEIRKEELAERLQWLTGKQTGSPPEAKVVHLESHK